MKFHDRIPVIKEIGLMIFNGDISWEIFHDLRSGYLLQITIEHLIFSEVNIVYRQFIHIRSIFHIYVKWQEGIDIEDIIATIDTLVFLIFTISIIVLLLSSYNDS